MTSILSTTLDRFETEFPQSASKCWRCDDTGDVESRSIVPRRLPCVCETAGREVEGAEYHKRSGSIRFEGSAKA